MSAAAPLPQQIKDWWEHLMLRVHRSGMEEKLPHVMGCDGQVFRLRDEKFNHVSHCCSVQTG